jgi:exosortase K
MNRHLEWKWILQCVVVLGCVFALKLHYSTASANELRWILAPTSACVELISGDSFEFESHAGYLSSDRSFLIASSCAGLNFLITAFLMLSARKLLRDRSKTPWWFLPAAAGIAFAATLVANTTRISIALWLKRTSLELSWLNPNQIHRFEGIAVYFVFLLLLFWISENFGRAQGSGSWYKVFLFPLTIYYMMMLGFPFANGAYLRGAKFWEYSFFVLLIPLALILPLAGVCIARRSRFLRHHHRRSFATESTTSLSDVL